MKKVSLSILVTVISACFSFWATADMRIWTIELDKPMEVVKFKKGEVWRNSLPSEIKELFPPSEQYEGNVVPGTDKADCSRSGYGMMSAMERSYLLSTNGLSGRYKSDLMEHYVILDKSKKKRIKAGVDPRDYYYIFRQGNDVLLVETDDLKTLKVRTLSKAKSGERPKNFQSPKSEETKFFSIRIYGFDKEAVNIEEWLTANGVEIEVHNIFDNYAYVIGKWKGGSLPLNFQYLAIDVSTKGQNVMWHYDGDCWPDWPI